jgi:hypothetical protein
VLIRHCQPRWGELVVVVPADQGEVGVAAVVPGDHVVALAPLGGDITAGEGAAGVAGDQGEGLGGGGDPAAAVEVEDRAFGVGEAERDVGLVREPPGFSGGDQGAVGVAADAVVAEEVVPGHGEQQGGGGAAGCGEVVGAEGGVEDRRQGVVAALPVGAFVGNHMRLGGRVAGTLGVGLELRGVACGEGSEEGGEFLSDVGGEAEVSGPGAVFASAGSSTSPTALGVAPYPSCTGGSSMSSRHAAYSTGFSLTLVSSNGSVSWPASGEPGHDLRSLPRMPRWAAVAAAPETVHASQSMWS